MDNVAYRTRYPRHGVSSRYKKRNVLENSSYKEKLAKQMVIAVLILMVAGIIKNANTSVTNFLTEKAQGILMQNIEIKSIYSTIGEILDKAFGKDDLNKDSENGTFPTSLTDGEDENNKFDGTGVKGISDTSTELSEISDVNESLSKTTPKPSSTPIAGAGNGTAPSKTASPTSTLGIFITPVNGMLGDTFGERVHPFTNKLTMHKGIDIEASQGASIKASAAGEVIEAGYEKTLGNYVKLSHTGNYNTIYAHCNELIIKKGQKVKQGDVIAKAGSTGLSTGVHLHFEIWKDGKVVNPLNYIKVPEK